jgi:hypothetical protein
MLLAPGNIGMHNGGGVARALAEASQFNHGREGKRDAGASPQLAVIRCCGCVQACQIRSLRRRDDALKSQVKQRAGLVEGIHGSLPFNVNFDLQLLFSKSLQPGKANFKILAHHLVHIDKQTHQFHYEGGLTIHAPNHARATCLRG